ncbi:TetR/AcrR family transcriptional regulator [Parasedimentitalea psychrophila]|uniref:TetR/AcrR family transcriptional regulator n=1 Tax=Parasedimentitalea psychrophila TaxID=2997337 RepID=A0A9Y2KX41_9RHOB|nr:TetR/AcrR family transcriptional regulator [Parasedimentitalea psychrophila]WIY24740.1 TetR/AcrR family transcriptional regulator [Parasedimentitalea psychrophila]
MAGSDSNKSETAPRRKNMRREDREKMIISEAVRFFAECGFEGQTRELAKRMGVSHAVIYRHFDSKDALIERVYDHVYVKRWNPDWEPLVLDRSRSLQDRMIQFYIEYANRVFDYDWVRIFVSSGLKSYGLTERYLDIIRTKIIRPAALELRYEVDRGSSAAVPTEEDLELFWGLHGAVFYIAIRKYVYGERVEIDIELAVTNTVSAFFNGFEKTVPFKPSEIAKIRSPTVL